MCPLFITTHHHLSLLPSYFWRALARIHTRSKKGTSALRTGCRPSPLCHFLFFCRRQPQPSPIQCAGVKNIIHQIIIIHPPLISSTNHPPATMGKSPYATIRLGLSTVVAMRSMFLVESYVVDGNAKGINILSRFADVQCKLLMTVGRTPSTDMREFVDRTRTIILSEVSPQGEK